MIMETSPHQMVDCSNIYYRSCRPTDIHCCLQIETASYPDDEAATETSLRYRQENASPYFLCAIYTKTTASSSVEINSTDPDDIVIGFICSTRCHTFTHDSMTVHEPDGSILAIHSVVIAESYRRRGIATQMLRHYIQQFVQQPQQQQPSATNDISETRISKIALLAKAYLLSFYVNCGFQVMRPSSITHGKELWYDLEMKLDESDALEANSAGRKYFVVDAFADSNKKGTGNPAAIVPVDCEPTDVSWMQVIAQEMNLSETAFVWKIPQSNDDTAPSSASYKNGDGIESNHYRIRYFTPTIEVDLCGHATLASAAILCNIHSTSNVVFHANHNVILRAQRNHIINNQCAQISMTFPTQVCTEIQQSHDDRAAVEAMLRNAFPTIASDDILYIGLVQGLSDLFVEVRHDAFLHDNTKSSDINVRAMMEWDGYDCGIILCCAGAGKNRSEGIHMNGSNDIVRIDFYSRFFGPKAGIDEDPVTGSAHCALAPYFGNKLQKLKLVGQQSSVRGGIIHCELSNDGNNVTLTGTAVTTASGTLWM